MDTRNRISQPQNDAEGLKISASERTNYGGIMQWVTAIEKREVGVGGGVAIEIEPFLTESVRYC